MAYDTPITLSPAAYAADGEWTVRKASGEVWTGAAGLQLVSLDSQAKETLLKPGDTVTTGRNGRVLLVQRPSAGRWANMWEFPHGPIQKSEESDDALVRLARELCGLKVEVQQEMSILKHALTRFRITMACFEATCSSGSFRSAFYQSAKWLRPNEVPNYPVSVPYRRLAKTLVSPSRQRRLF